MPMAETNCAFPSAQVLLWLRIITEEITFMRSVIIERVLNGKSGFLSFGLILLTVDCMTLIKLFHFSEPWFLI